MIDPSIIGRQNAFQMPDTLGTLTNALQAKGLIDQSATNALSQEHMRYQIAAQKRLDAQQETINKVYSTAIDPATGEIDQKKLVSALALAGQGGAIPGVQKGLLETQKLRGDVTKTAEEVRQKQMEGEVGNLLNLSKSPTDDALNAFLAREGAHNPGVKMIHQQAMALTDPAQRTLFLQNIIRQTPNGLAALGQVAPKVALPDTGGALTPYNENPYAPGGIGPIAGAAPLVKTATIGENETAGHNRVTEGQGAQRLGIEGAQLGLAGQRLGIERGNQSIAQRRLEADLADRNGLALSKGPNGEDIYLPKTIQPGATPPTAVNALGANGQPMPGKVPESRQKEADKLAAEASTISGALKAVEATPNAFSFRRGMATLGGPMAESIIGRTDSPEESQARSYVYNVVSKVINERAGAAQTPSEMTRLRSFLPAETDSAAQITNKLNGFQTYIKDQQKVYGGGANSETPSTGGWSIKRIN